MRRRGNRLPVTGEDMLQRAASVVAGRRKTYGDPRAFMTVLAQRWSITLGHPVTPAQVVLCLLDLKLARLRRDPKHQDPICDLAGYAAILQELTR
jgi:hypothetical protein